MKITESLRWVIGLIVTIILGLYAVYYPNLQKEKRFSYKILSYYQTIEKDSSLKNDLKVVFRDKELENLYSVLIEFQNSGNVPIRSADFESDIIMSFDSSAKVIKASVSETSPENIPVTLTFSDSVIKIKPTLLNIRDKFMLQIFMTGESELPIIDGRIAGVNKIEENAEIIVEYTKSQLLIWLDGIYGFLLIILSGMFVSIYFFRDNVVKFSKHELLVYCVILFGGGAGLIGNWGEDINFMLPKWANIAITFTSLPFVIWTFYKLKLRQSPNETINKV